MQAMEIMKTYEATVKSLCEYKSAANDPAKVCTNQNTLCQNKTRKRKAKYKVLAPSISLVNFLRLAQYARSAINPIIAQKCLGKQARALSIVEDLQLCVDINQLKLATNYGGKSPRLFVIVYSLTTT